MWSYRVHRNEWVNGDRWIQTDHYEDSEFFSQDEGDAMAEALNVIEITGLSPSQLVSRVAELESRLRAINQTLRKYNSWYPVERAALERAMELSKLP